MFPQRFPELPSTRIRACEQLQKSCEHEQRGTRLISVSNANKSQILRALLNWMRPFNIPNAYPTLILAAILGEVLHVRFGSTCVCTSVYTIVIYTFLYVEAFKTRISLRITHGSVPLSHGYQYISKIRRLLRPKCISLEGKMFVFLVICRDNQLHESGILPRSRNLRCFQGILHVGTVCNFDSGILQELCFHFLFARCLCFQPLACIVFVFSPHLSPSLFQWPVPKG